MSHHYQLIKDLIKGLENKYFKLLQNLIFKIWKFKVC